MSWSLLVLFCRKELRDIRSNRRIWPGYLVLPGVGILLPLLVVFLLPVLLDPLQQASDPMPEPTTIASHRSSSFVCLYDVPTWARMGFS